MTAEPQFPQHGMYVKTGLAGYGPDLDEYDEPYGSWEEVADAIAMELVSLADLEYDSASAIAASAEKMFIPAVTARSNPDWMNQAHARFRALAERGVDYRDAWLLREHADSMMNLAASFSNDRKDAPLYKDDPALWHVTIVNLIMENLPVTYDQGRSRLYVWEAPDAPDKEG